MLCYVIPMLMTLVMHLCSPCNRRTINFYDDDDDDAKFHLDPSNRLATVHERYGQAAQDRQTGQRSGSIGRTVLQTVVQK